MIVATIIVPTHVLVIENQNHDLAIIYAEAPNLRIPSVGYPVGNTFTRFCPVHPHSQPPFKWSPVYLPQRPRHDDVSLLKVYLFEIPNHCNKPVG